MVTTPLGNPFKNRDRPHIHESEASINDLPADALYLIQVARTSLLNILDEVNKCLTETVDDKHLVLAGIIGLRMELVNSMVRTFEAEGQYLHIVYREDGYDAILTNIEPKTLTVDEAMAKVRDLVE